MNIARFLLVVAVAAGWVANGLPTGRAAVLLSDNFNVGADGNLVAFNPSSAARQGAGNGLGGSTLGTVDWRSPRDADPDVDVPNKIVGDQAQLSIGSQMYAFNSTVIYPDHNFVDQAIIDAGGFVVEWDFDPLAPDFNQFDGSEGWASFGFGRTKATLDDNGPGGQGDLGNDVNEFLVNNTSGFDLGTDWAFLARPTGQLQVFTSPSNDVTGSALYDAGGGPGSTATVGKTYHFKVVVELDADFAAGATANVTYSVDGIVLQQSADGSHVDSLQIAFDGDGQNYLFWETDGGNDAIPDGNNGIDNIVISTLPPALEADFNDDSMVDGTDLAQWKGDFGIDNDSDADGDGDSDGADFLVWQRQFGSTSATPSAAAIPEPAAWLLCVVGLPLMAQRRTGPC